MENKPFTKKQFLITAFPRSGTNYIASCLRRFGWGIATEMVLEHSHGTVSWVHTPCAKDFKTTALQMRNPLKVISSAQTIPVEVWEKHVATHIGRPKKNYTPKEMAIYAYPKWYRKAYKHADVIYRIEDIENIYKDLMGYLGLTPPDEWTKQVPTTQNTRASLYTPLTWKDIESTDNKSYKQIQTISKQYNYD